MIVIRLYDQDSGLDDQDSGLGVQDSGLGVQDSGLGVQDSEKWRTRFLSNLRGNGQD